MRNYENYENIEACIEAITRRKAIVKNATMVVSLVLIPLIWILPSYARRINNGSTLPPIIWVWGWHPDVTLVWGWQSDITLAYSIGISILLACQVIVAWRGCSQELTGSTFLFLACLFNGTMFCMSMVIHLLILVLWIVEGFATIAFCSSCKMYGLTSKEQKLFQKAAQHIVRIAVRMQESGIGEVNQKDVDEIRQDLLRIEAYAWRWGIYIQNEVKSGREALINLDIRCSIGDAIRTDGAINFDKLCTISGLSTEQFAPLLLGMCRDLNLSTDGNVVTAKNDQDAIDLLQEIEGYFSKWREVEASKTCKV